MKKPEPDRRVPGETHHGGRWLGTLAILAVMAIYTTNLVFIRYSVLNGLTALDLAALRYGVSGAVLLPHFFRLGVRDLGGVGWTKGITLFCLAGAPYMVVFFYGIRLSEASHGAVLNPGVVPSVVFLTMAALGLQSFSTTRAVSLVLILVGLVLVTAPSFQIQGDMLLGDALLLLTGISWGWFTLSVKLWKLQPLQAATIVSVLSLVYLPVYFLWGLGGGRPASATHVVLQAVFQGVVNSILTIYLVTFAVHRLGPQRAALFSPLVPLMTTVLAVPLLGEIPSALQWGGIAIVVLGMFWAAGGKDSQIREENGAGA